MATATFNLIEDSELDITANTGRIVIRGMISNITADSASDAEIMWRAKAACETAGYAINSVVPNHPELVLRRILIRGFTNDGCNVWLSAELPNFGGTPVSTLLVRDRQSMTGNTSNSFVDSNGKRRPISVLGGTFDVGGASVTLDPDLAMINSLDPCRILEVSGLSYGERANGGKSIFGRVNSDDVDGLGPGYWLCVENETTVSKYAGYFTFSFAAASRVTKDWSELAYLRSELTGKFIKIPDADIDTLNSGEYVNDLVQVPGGTRVGRFPMTAFNPVFGGAL